MTIAIPKTLYPKSVLLQAAYQFTDVAYIYIRQSGEDYIVDITAKAEASAVEEQAFKNELLSQAVRYEIFLQTKEVRTLITQRALASTIVGEPPEVMDTEVAYTENDILKDWFESENTHV